MGLLISFTPWFLFWVFAIRARIELAAISGLLAIIAIITSNRRHGRSVKSLQLGTLIFFVLIALAVPIFGKEVIASKIDLLGNSGVAVIVLVTIILKRPFTIDFFREIVGEDLRNNPRFIRANYVISWFWLFILLVNLSLVVARHYSFITIDRWVSVAIRILNCFAAVKFSLWYMRRSVK